jgi:phage terminase large subunit-like protein
MLPEPKPRSYLGNIDIETFDPASYARSKLPTNYSQLSPIQKQQARILATKNDPLLFGIIYFEKSLTAGGEGMTFSDFHVTLCKIARLFRNPLDPINPLRFAFIAPRRAGKTTWLYKIVLFWLAAHKHRKFFHVVTATGGQAQKWMKNFQIVIDQNERVQNDFPELCTPMVRQSTGKSFADGGNLYMATSGFVLGTQGADGNSLGLIMDDERPDFILFDDIEPPSGSYSQIEMEKRLDNILEGAIPMGAEGCSIIMVGTVFKPGSIMDQLRTHSVKPEKRSWITEEEIKVIWQMPFVNRITGEQAISAPNNGQWRSFWPGRHQTEVLMRTQKTMTFAIKYANSPRPENGAFWREGSFRQGTIPPEESTITAIVLDPAVTTKKTSDFSAIVVIRYAPRIGVFEILYGHSARLSPGVELPQEVKDIHGWFPEATVLIVDTTHGRGLWEPHFNDIPGLHYTPISLNKSDGNKSARAVPVFRMYEQGRVLHSTEEGSNLQELELELESFPNGLHDDLPDALCFGVITLLNLYGRGRQQEDSEEMYV